MSTHIVFYPGCSPSPAEHLFGAFAGWRSGNRLRYTLAVRTFSRTTPSRGVEGESLASPILLGIKFVARFILKDDVINSSCGEALFCDTEAASQLVLRVWSSTY